MFQTIKLTILRNGQEQIVPVILEARAAGQETKTASSVAGMALGPIPSDHPDAKGVFVSAVEPGSAADQAGVVAGDIVLSVDKQPVGSAEMVESIYQRSKGPTLLRILRGEDELFVVLQR